MEGFSFSSWQQHTALHNEENPLLCVKDYRIVLYFFGLFAPPQANITEMQAIPHRKAGLSEPVWYTGITTQATSNLSRSSGLFHFISNTNILKKFFLLLFQLAYFYTRSIHMDLSLWPLQSLLKICALNPTNFVFSAELQHVFCSRYCSENSNSGGLSPAISHGRFLKERDLNQLWHNYIWGSCKLSRRASTVWSQNAVSLVKSPYLKLLSPTALEMN